MSIHVLPRLGTRSIITRDTGDEYLVEMILLIFLFVDDPLIYYVAVVREVSGKRMSDSLITKLGNTGKMGRLCWSVVWETGESMGATTCPASARRPVGSGSWRGRL